MSKPILHNPLRFMISCRFLLPLLLALTQISALAAAAPAQPEVSVEMNRSKGYPLFEVNAAITADADIARSWRVLTDYDGLAGFVPNLSTSQLVSSSGDERVVAQTGFAKFLFLRQAVNLLLHVTEQPMQAIAIDLVSGNMREYRARWELQPLDNGRTRILYTGAIAPDFYVPTLFGAALMKSDLRGMLSAVKAEIEKRP